MHIILSAGPDKQLYNSYLDFNNQNRLGTNKLIYLIFPGAYGGSSVLL